MYHIRTNISIDKYKTIFYKSLVDPNDFLWNTFFDYVFEWYPILKQIYNVDEP